MQAAADANWRDLFEKAPCALLSTLSDGTIRNVNQTFCLWLGYAPGELIGKRRLQDMLTIGCRIYHETHWLPLLQMQGAVAEIQMELIHRDGHTLPMLISARLHNRADIIHHNVALFLASDRRKYERELLLARQKAEELLGDVRSAKQELARTQDVLREQEQQARLRAQLAEQLVGIVSHDLRSPLHAASLAAKWLASCGLPPPQSRAADQVTVALGRAKRLISDLLDFTQARLGTSLPICPRSTDIHTVVADVIDELALIWQGRKLEHIQRGGGVCRADPDRIAQAIANLAGNALTYGSPRYPVTITSIVERELVVQVHNHGTEISPELLPHIFEPLRRGEQEVRLGSRSLGLGLFIVQQIAIAHAGTVSVQSSRAEGTTFTLTIPQPGELG